MRLVVKLPQSLPQRVEVGLFARPFFISQGKSYGFVIFDPKSGGLAVLVFGNEMVSSVLDDVWGRGHPWRFTSEPAV